MSNVQALAFGVALAIICMLSLVGVLATSFANMVGPDGVATCVKAAAEHYNERQEPNND